MLEKMRVGLARAIASQLRCPTDSIGGRVVMRHFQKQSAYLEKGAVKLLNIQPDDKVLEVGFGGGIGIRTAYWRVAGGNGMVYGVERSHFMLEKAKKFCALEITEGKVHLSLALVTHLPFPDAFFDRVFHCNCYFYWDDFQVAAKEMKRVMKPGAVMVATLTFDDLRSMDEKGYLQGCSTDPLDYMHSLEAVGFHSVHIKYMTASEKSYQGIFATKPLDEVELLPDDQLEQQEELFRKVISKFEAGEAMRKTGRPTPPGFDPIAGESKVSKQNDDPLLNPK